MKSLVTSDAQKLVAVKEKSTSKCHLSRESGIQTPVLCWLKIQIQKSVIATSVIFTAVLEVGVTG